MPSAFRTLIHFDELVPRLLRNTGMLVASSSTVGLLGLATIAITARALGPAGIGIIALIEAYVRSVDLLVRMQPTQVVIKYAADALESDDHERFKGLVKLSFLIDLVGGVISGCIAILLARWATVWFGIGEDGDQYIFLVAIALFFSFRPTGIAVLRLFDRFDLLAITDTGVAFARLCIAAVALVLDLGIWAFVVLLFLQSMADGLIVFFWGLRELRRRGYKAIWRASAYRAFANSSGFFGFLVTANLSNVLRQAVNRFDVLLLGALVGPTVVGLYQIAKRSGKAVQRLGRTFTQVLFPELAKMWARGERGRFGRMIQRVTLFILAVSTLLFVPLAFFVTDIIRVVFGPEFLDAVPIIYMQFVAIIINLTGFAFIPALLSMGLHNQLLVVTTIATLAFSIAFVPAVMIGSAVGAMSCHVLFSLVWFGGCLWLLARNKRSLEDAR